MLRATPIRPRPAVAGKCAPGKPQALTEQGRSPISPALFLQPLLTQRRGRGVLGSSSASWRWRIFGRGWALAPPDWCARCAAWPGRRASAVEDRREVEPAEALGVGEYVNLDDFPAPDRETHHREWPSPRGRYESGGSVDERRPREGSKLREGERLPGHGARPPDHPRRARGSGVCPEHDFRIEHREERVEVAAARGGEEGVDDLPLAAEIGVGSRGRPPHAAACPARQLPRRAR